MNHNYSPNGLPFSQSAQHHSGASYPPQPSPVSSGPGIPGQYVYSLPHSPYPQHAYPPYPPYAPQMMTYAPPRPNPNATIPSPSNAPSPVLPAAPSIGKRKRRTNAESPRGKGGGDKDSDQEAGASGSDKSHTHGNQQTSQSASAVTLAEMKKRTKTQRACDSCRSRKIRFVFSKFLFVSFLPPMHEYFHVGYLFPLWYDY